MNISARNVPSQLRIMADHIGEDAMMKLLAEYGGVHLRVPTLERIPAGHRLIELLGGDALNLCSQYGGELLSIPKAQSAILAIRNRQIRASRLNGRSHASLAREYNLTERHIISICMAHDPDDRETQCDLFE